MRFVISASQVNHFVDDDEQPQQQQHRPRRRRQQSNGVANDAEIISNTAAGEDVTTNVGRGQSFCEALWTWSSVSLLSLLLVAISFSANFS